MENINEHIANKIKELRKANGLTQNELAEKINYSNKAISRWENGEVVPDIETLYNMCKIFGVPISSMFEDGNEKKPQSFTPKLKIGNKLAITLLAISGVWVIATLIYLTLLYFEKNLWQVFITAIPLSCIIGIIFNAIWGKSSTMFMILTVLLWSALTAVYLWLPPDLWYIYFVGIPLQIAIMLCGFITLNIHNKKIEHKKSEKIEHEENNS